MSDAVVLALIAMFQSWGDKFIANLAIIVPAVGTAVIGWMTWRNNAKSVERAERLKAQIALVEAQATRSTKEVSQAFAAGKREGYVEGIPEGVKQAVTGFNSIPQPLKPRQFDPMSTDVFMTGKGP